MFERFSIHSRIIHRSGITFYGAHDKLLGREIWLWRLYEFDGTYAPPGNEQLSVEKASLLKLRDPRIVRVHDIEADPDGVVALVEPAAGESLDEWIARGPADLVEFNQIAEACLRSLAAAASAGVPHGALEPGLVFVNRAEHARIDVSLLGFGIARLVTRLAGSDLDSSEAGDVWMLGGVLHALLVGAQDEGALLMPPHHSRPEVPVANSDWVMGLMAEDPAARPQSAAEALAQFTHAISPPAFPPGAPSQFAPPAAWPAGYPAHTHMPPGWHYPPAAVWHMPPAQWPQPYDPTLAAQPGQMWQQVPWQPWPAQMQQGYQHPHAAQPPVTSIEATPAPASQTSGPISRPLVKSNAARGTENKPAAPVATRRKSLKKWIGPLVSLAAAAVVVWVFRDVFAPVLQRETWEGMLGQNVKIQWPGKSQSAVPAASKEAAVAVSTVEVGVQPAKPEPAKKRKPRKSDTGK